MKNTSLTNGIGRFVVFLIISCAFTIAHGQTPVPAPYDANVEARISALEEALKSNQKALDEALKKKADKPDPTKGFVTKVDGRIYLDSYHVSGDPGSGTASFRDDWNYNGFKDLRIGVTGEGYKNYAFKSDFHFGTDGKVEIRDVWLSASKVPLLDTVKIGHQRIEEGMSSLQAGLHTMFMFFEGADFVHFYRLGASSRHLWAQDRLRFFVGIYEFKHVAQLARTETSRTTGWGTVGNFRLTYMPYISKDAEGKADGRKFMLFGVNYGYYDVNDPTQTFTERYSQAFGSLQRITIGNVNHFQQVGLEFAMQHGPFALLSETYLRTYDRYGDLGDLTVWGMYLEGRIFLTGDYRRFNPAQAVWGAVKLNHNLEFEKMRDWNIARYLGAWELAAKWSYTDLGDFGKADLPGFLAPRVHDFTLGLNWYWSERIRMMFNYSRIVPTEKIGGHSGMDMFAAGLRYYF